MSYEVAVPHLFFLSHCFRNQNNASFTRSHSKCNGSNSLCTQSRHCRCTLALSCKPFLHNTDNDFKRQCHCWCGNDAWPLMSIMIWQTLLLRAGRWCHLLHLKLWSGVVLAIPVHQQFWRCSDRFLELCYVEHAFATLPALSRLEFAWALLVSLCVLLALWVKFMVLGQHVCSLLVIMSLLCPPRHLVWGFRSLVDVVKSSVVHPAEVLPNREGWQGQHLPAPSALLLACSLSFAFASSIVFATRRFWWLSACRPSGSASTSSSSWIWFPFASAWVSCSASGRKVVGYGMWTVADNPTQSQLCAQDWLYTESEEDPLRS